jgi:hypothetical protein
MQATSYLARPRTARLEKDWTRKRRRLRKTADLSPLYFNDCTALLGLITMDPIGPIFLDCRSETHSLQLYVVFKE